VPKASRLGIGPGGNWGSMERVDMPGGELSEMGSVGMGHEKRDREEIKCGGKEDPGLASQRGKLFLL